MKWLMMAAGLVFLQAIVGCAFLKKEQYCNLTNIQKEIAIGNLNKLISDISNNETTYEVSGLLMDGQAYSTNGLCWVLLHPRSRQAGVGVFDGEIAVYLDKNTMAVVRYEKAVW